MRHCPTEYPKKRPPLHACPRLGKLIVSADVAFGSKADISACPRHVRFTSNSGHCRNSVVDHLTSFLLIARFIISPMRNRTRESSISSLYPTIRDVNRFSSMPVSILSLLGFAEKSRSGLSSKRGIGHRPFCPQHIMLLSIALDAAFDCPRADLAAAFASCSAPFTKRSLSSFVWLTLVKFANHLVSSATINAASSLFGKQIRYVGVPTVPN
jgi:hypothetical protein